MNRLCKGLLIKTSLCKINNLHNIINILLVYINILIIFVSQRETPCYYIVWWLNNMTLKCIMKYLNIYFYGF